MATVIVNKFDGGHAEDLRTFATNESEYSKNFDIFTNPHYLQPYPDTVTETMVSGTITDYKLTDVISDINILDGDTLIALGQAGSSDTNLKFFSKDNLTEGWTNRAERTSGSVKNNTLIGYKGLAYALEQSGADITLLELTNSSTITTRGTISSVTSACKPFIHPGTGFMYLGTDNVISRSDGASVTSYNGIIPTNLRITSITNYGTYLAVGTRPVNGFDRSIAFIINPSNLALNSTASISNIVDFGKGNLNVLDNMGDILVGVITTNNPTTVIDNKLVVKTWAGGEVQIVKEVDIDSTIATSNIILKAKADNKLYFALSLDDCIWAFAKNKEGAWTLTKDKYVVNGTAVTGITGLSILNDIMWVGFSTAGITNGFYRTTYSTGSPTTDYTATSTYRTTLNPSMPLADRYKDKELKAVQIAFTGATSGTTVVKYSVDGSSMTSILSNTNAAGEYVISTTNETTNALPFLTGKEFQFQIESTGKSKIKELRYKYETLNEIL